jgi:acyl carrier protein
MNVATLSAETSALESLQTWLVNNIAEQCDLDPQEVDIRKPLTNYGLDSIIAFTVVGDLEDYLEIELPATLLWDYPTIEAIAEYVAQQTAS